VVPICRRYRCGRSPWWLPRWHADDAVFVRPPCCAAVAQGSANSNSTHWASSSDMLAVQWCSTNGDVCQANHVDWNTQLSWVHW